MFRLVVLACVLACAFASLVPLGYSGLGYSGLAHPALGYRHPVLAAPVTYSGVPTAYSAAAFPTYETVSHSVDITHEPVEQHGYVVKY
ncbi:hypothetical protein FJT64_011600 [Amphibalanus amphitrite]|uniref:Uncharacterized protein n=1 Tax=Amphibalanus amphitrite TaxID=1232801 RepID=A0A6A4VFU9_AMPAM|nr:hypothetical protein FJT64_011600 [Amphibalanus amphitrite]